MRKKSRRRYAEEWIRGRGGGEEGELDENKLDKQGKEEKELWLQRWRKEDEMKHRKCGWKARYT